MSDLIVVKTFSVFHLKEISKICYLKGCKVKHFYLSTLAHTLYDLGAIGSEARTHFSVTPYKMLHLIGDDINCDKILEKLTIYNVRLWEKGQFCIGQGQCSLYQVNSCVNKALECSMCPLEISSGGRKESLLDRRRVLGEVWQMQGEFLMAYDEGHMTRPDLYGDRW